MSKHCHRLVPSFARVAIACLFAMTASLTVTGASAQTPEPGSPWDAGVQQQAPAAPAPVPEFNNTTVVPRVDGGVQSDTPVPVQLVAHLTAEGQKIDDGVVWRVFQDKGEAEGRSVLVSTVRDASPTVKLKPGTYAINAAFGKANLTRRIAVPGVVQETPLVETFVLNAGGLRVTALAGGTPAAAGIASYSLYSDRDQSDNRKAILTDAKPGLVVRLNAGIYQLVSKYGDCNAVVRSDVTVEAGKLTEATITHSVAKVTFKLVARAGGEALPDTQWTIQSEQGATIKDSVGALPTHMLAPGTYTVIAKSQEKSFERSFTLADGDNRQIEVIVTE